MGKAIKFPVTPKDAIEYIAETNPEYITQALMKAEMEIREEAKNAIEHPEKRNELMQICEEMQDILDRNADEGHIEFLTPLHQKCLRHYVNVYIPAETNLDGTDWKRFLKLLSYFNFCNWSTEGEDEIVLGLSYQGIYQ